jgi:uncharacterized protein (TIGR02001 family)
MIAATSAGLVSVSVAGDRWGGSIALTTDYLLRSISQSDGGAAVQADLHYKVPSGWIAGVWASTIEVDTDDGRTAELNLYAGRAWQTTEDWSVSLTIAHYAYPWNTRSQLYEYDELIAQTAFRDLVFVTFAISPDTRAETDIESREHTAISGELGVRLPLYKRVSVAAGIGRYSLRSKEGGAYWYWSSGLVCDFRPWQLEAVYFDASDNAWAQFDPGLPHGHWAATLLRRF